MVEAVTVPVDGQGVAVFIVRGHPSLEGGVGGPQARVIPVRTPLPCFKRNV